MAAMTQHTTSFCTALLACLLGAATPAFAADTSATQQLERWSAQAGAPGNAVLQRADVVQGDFAEKDGEQDVAIEVVEPAPQAANFVTGKEQRDRFEHAMGGRRRVGRGHRDVRRGGGLSRWGHAIPVAPYPT